jgi:hypothetical protein
MTKNNIAELGRKTRFSSTNQPKNNGRKPKLYTQLKGVYKISQEEYRNVVLHLMQLSKAEVLNLAKAEDTPIWVVTICEAFLADIEKGTFYILSDLTDRVYGKPKQVTENYNENTDKSSATIVFVKEDER